MKKLILGFSILCFSCASYHHKSVSTSLDPQGADLKISVDPISEYSDTTNVYLDFAIENTGTRWMKVDQVAIEFPTQSGTVHNVIVGDDLKAWANSLENRMKVRDHNSSIGIASLILGGTVVALAGITRHDSGLATVGAAATAVGAGWDATRDIKKAQREAQTAYYVPENYLLAPLTIPSHGLLRRWVLVNIPEKLIAKTALLTLKTIEGETMRFNVPIVFPQPWNVSQK